ncbi:MAG: DUF5700 domain-containing putative Zn-dependent protease [Pyrinomonadaceae bacterium]
MALVIEAGISMLSLLNVLKSRVVIITTIVLSLLILCSLKSHTDIAARETNRHESANRQVDFTQAEMVLNLLRSSANGNVDPQMIEYVLNVHGTALIISQQNISRTVTREQYRVLLSALNRGELPDIAPVDASERSRRGVEGLRKDVWFALRWGRTKTNLLAERIEEIKRHDFSRNVKALAIRFLPEPVELSLHLYIVMGGRAGAAALSGDEIYFDVLATSYRAANGALQYPAPAEIGEYFAHEIHHIGLSQILNRTRRHLRLNNQEQQAFSFLTALVMEGSASYLINAHRSLDVMSRDPQFTESLKKGDELLKLSEQVLRSVLESNLDGEAYDKATTPFLGSGWHSAGAIMLAAIDQANGLRAMMKVLRDPRKLLVEYNRAVAKLKSTIGRQPFDTKLAGRISSMGA